MVDVQRTVIDNRDEAAQRRDRDNAGIAGTETTPEQLARQQRSAEWNQRATLDHSARADPSTFQDEKVDENAVVLEKPEFMSHLDALAARARETDGNAHAIFMRVKHLLSTLNPIHFRPLALPAEEPVDDPGATEPVPDEPEMNVGTPRSEPRNEPAERPLPF